MTITPHPDTIQVPLPVGPFQAYTHVLPDGTNLTVMVDPLVAWVRHQFASTPYTPEAVLPYGLEAVRTQIDPEWLQRVTDEGTIEPHRFERAVANIDEENYPPVMFGAWPDGCHVMLDGHHRTAALAERGHTTVKSVLIPYEVWQRFLAPGITEQYTAEQVTRMPSGIA